MTMFWRQMTIVTAVIALWGGVLAGASSAAPLPKGDCAAPKPFTDLQHCNFNGANLRNKDLRGVNLRNLDSPSHLGVRTDLQGADLRGANLQRADLREVKLQKANLQGADLRKADLREANLYLAKLQGANLTDALVDGKMITEASLDGVIGLPTEALKVLKNQYLVTNTASGDIVVSALTREYGGDRMKIAGLSDIFFAQTIPGTSNTITLLSYPFYADGSDIIFARFEGNKFEVPACARKIDLFREGEPSHYAHWDSMQVRPLKSGTALIGVRARGGESDGERGDAWSKVVIVLMSASCQVTRLYSEMGTASYTLVQDEKTGDERAGAWCGGFLEYRLLDDRTAEIVTTIEASTEKECGVYASPQKQVLRKPIELKIPQ